MLKVNNKNTRTKHQTSDATKSIHRRIMLLTYIAQVSFSFLFQLQFSIFCGNSFEKVSRICSVCARCHCFLSLITSFEQKIKYDLKLNSGVKLLRHSILG